MSQLALIHPRNRLTGRSIRKRGCEGREAASGLVDEYPTMVYPVLVGGEVPFFSRGEHRVDLELVEARNFNSGITHLRHRVVS